MAIVSLVPAVAWFCVAAPAWSLWHDQELRLQERRTVLAHMRAAASTLPSLRDALAGSDTQREGALLLPGATDAVAAADLQGRVETIAAAAGIALLVLETPAPVAVARWHRVGVRIGFSAPWTALVGLLRSIEDLPIRVFIDDLSLHCDAPGNRSATRPVQASMFVYGFTSAQADSGK